MIEEMFRLRIRWKLVPPMTALLAILLLLLYAYQSQPSCSLSYLSDSSLKHLFEYCNVIKKHNIEQEGTVPMSEYKLESVHVAIRHGDRQSLHKIKNYERLLIGCRITPEHIVMSDVHEMKGYVEFMQAQSMRSKDQSFTGYKLYPNKELCEPSELTPRGASQHVHNGLMLRKRYIENLKLLDEGSLYEEVLIRSTSFSRTFQSGLAFMYGLLGDHFEVSKLDIEECESNTFCYENKGNLPCNCPYVRPFLDTMSPTYHQLHSDVLDIRKTVNIMNHFAEVFKVPRNKVPKVSHMMDFSMVHVCNKQMLPSMIGNDGKQQQCVSSWAVRDTYDTMQKNGEKQVKTPQYQKISRLKFLPLLDEIKNRMLLQSKGETPLKFVLYSGHDSSLNALAIALNFSNGHWPPYASKIVLELYSTTSIPISSESSLFVRVLYNGKVVTTDMDFCKGHIHTKGVGYEAGLCPFSVFANYVDSKILEDIDETSYDSACTQVSVD